MTNRIMRKLAYTTLAVVILCSAPLFPILQAQDLVIEGKARVSNMVKDNAAAEVVVRLVDGILGVRDAVTLGGESLASRGIISSPRDTTWSFLGSGYCESEAGAQYHMPRNGTLKNLSVKALQSITAGSSVTVTVRKNGADSALSLTFTSVDGTTVKTDPDTVAVSAGDLITVKYEETLGVEQGSDKYFSTFVDFE